MKKLQRVLSINDSSEATAIDENKFDVSMIAFDEKENIRLDYDLVSLKELAASININGQLQPVGIKKTPDKNGKYLLIYGYRRFKAITEILKRDIIKITYIDLDNKDEIQLIENIQRDDLTDLEIAKGLDSLKKQFNLINKQIAKKINKSEKWVKDKLTHLEIIKEVKEIDKGTPAYLPKLSTSKVIETRGLEKKDKKKVLRDAGKNKLNREQIREKTKKIKAKKTLRNSPESHREPRHRRTPRQWPED